MICSSRPVPSVAVTSACVSPRVNSAEPCVRGSTPARIVDRAHGARVAAVDARLAVEDLAAHDLRFEVEQQIVDLTALRVGAAFRPTPTASTMRFADRVERLRARLLLRDLVGLAQLCFGELRDARDERFVLRRRLPVPRRLAGLVGELVDRLIAACICSWPNTTAPSITSSDSSCASDSTISTRLLGAGDDQVQLRLLELRRGRVQHVLAVRRSRRARRRSGR